MAMRSHPITANENPTGDEAGGAISDDDQDDGKAGLWGVTNPAITEGSTRHERR